MGTDSDPDAPEMIAMEKRLSVVRGQLANLEKLLHLPGKALTEVETHVVPAWRRRTAGEARWAVTIAIALAIGLELTLPARLAVPPRWLLPAVGGLLLIGLLVANPRRIDRRSMPIRATSVLLTGVMSLANAVSALRLMSGLLRGRATEDAGLLLRWGGAVWFTNVVIFALWYWELDRGGPGARAEGLHQYPDLLFPQMGNDNAAPIDWEPTFLDYLYVAFTNATAFSPTDVLPLTRWAKMMFMAQSLISVGTVVLVVARAVNIFP